MVPPSASQLETGNRVKDHVQPQYRNEEMGDIINRTEDFVKEYMSSDRFDSSHDYSHVQRVVNLAIYLARETARGHPDEESLTYQEDVIRLGALLHDVWDRKYSEETSQALKRENGQQSDPPNEMPSHGGSPATPDDDPMLSLFENRLGMSKDLALKIKDLISHVSWTTEMKSPWAVQEAIKRVPELAYVQDADRIDALGAIGVGRAFTYNACAYERAKQAGQKLDWATGNSMNDAIAHYEARLLKAQGWMKTDLGKMVARHRSHRLEKLKEWWMQEMKFAEKCLTEAEMPY